MYLVLVIAIVVAVRRAGARIDEVEGADGHRAASLSRQDRWRQAAGKEKLTFTVMAIAAALWLLLILPVGFAAAVAWLGVVVWKRPYLEATLAPVVVVGGCVVAVYDLLVPLVRDDRDWGAAVLNAALFGGVWVLIGVLLVAAGRSSNAPMDTGIPENRI